MTNLSDKARLLGASEDTAKAIKAAQGIISIIPVYGSICNFALEGFAEFLDVNETKVDELSNTVNQIKKDLDEVLKELDDLEKKILGGGELTVRSQIMEKLVLARQATDYIKIFLKHPDNKYCREDFIDNALPKSKDAADSLRDNYWARIFSEEALFHGPENSTLFPSEYSNIIFDYRLALPVFLEAIFVRIFALEVMGTTNPEYSKAWLDIDIRSYAKRLCDVRDKILNDICITPRPDREIPPNWYPWTWWNDVVARYEWMAAVEKYSGFYYLRRYPYVGRPICKIESVNCDDGVLMCMDKEICIGHVICGNLYFNDNSSEEDAQRQLAIYQLRSNYLLKELYDQLGLTNLDQIIKSLYARLGEDIKFKNPPLNFFSLRNSCSIINKINPEKENSNSIRKAYARIKTSDTTLYNEGFIDAISTRKIFLMYDELYGIYGETGKIVLYKDLILKIDADTNLFIDLNTGKQFNEYW